VVSDSPYSDLDRPPLNARALQRALVVPGGLWTRLDLRAETGSTNADAIGAARDGEPEGLVVVAERQRAGRGRLGREWTSPPRAGLTASVLLRPGEAVPARGWSPAAPSRYGWLPLLAGVALVESVQRLAEVDAALKWPNDLLVRSEEHGYAKCAGILAEAGHGAVVVGVGLNVTLRADELPAPGPATSLRLAGASATDRDPLLRALLRALATWYERWRDAAGDPDACGLRTAYTEACATVGRTVRVLLPGGGELAGLATGVDADGRLTVRAAGDGERAVAAGDVLHVR
jgi:BirA family transcriptional regulator, biotin operon repressor / biotin---[acetyl-CoA-carboxylase] ligase